MAFPSNANSKTPLVKTIILGDTGVGKTTLIKSFLDLPISTMEKSTSQSQNYTREVSHNLFPDKQIMLDIWDTAGQEKYRAITKFYYKNVKIALFVYDCTNESSFHSLGTFWIQNVKEHNNNNINLIEDKKVFEEDAFGLVKEHNADFFAVSAVNGIGIKEMFEKIVYEYIVENEQCFQKEDINKNLVLNNQMLTYHDSNTKKKCC